MAKHRLSSLVSPSLLSSEASQLEMDSWFYLVKIKKNTTMKCFLFEAQPRLVKCLQETVSSDVIIAQVFLPVLFQYRRVNKLALSQTME